MALSLKDLKGGRDAPAEAVAFDGGESRQVLAELAERHPDRATRRRAASRLAGGRGHEDGR